MKWSDLFAKVATVSESLFNEVDNFKRGKVLVEIEGDVKLVIKFEKNLEGKVDAQFFIEPLVKETKTSSLEEKKESETTAVVEKIKDEEESESQDKQEQSKEEPMKKDEEKEQFEFLY